VRDLIVVSWSGVGVVVFSPGAEHTLNGVASSGLTV